jgi:hypothetical protein
MGYSCFIFTSSHIEELDFYPLLGISKVENAGQWLKITPFRLPLESQGSSTVVCRIKIGIVSRISKMHSYRPRPG